MRWLVVFLLLPVVSGQILSDPQEREEIVINAFLPSEMELVSGTQKEFEVHVTGFLQCDPEEPAPTEMWVGVSQGGGWIISTPNQTYDILQLEPVEFEVNMIPQSDGGYLIDHKETIQAISKDAFPESKNITVEWIANTGTRGHECTSAGWKYTTEGNQMALEILASDPKASQQIEQQESKGAPYPWMVLLWGLVVLGTWRRNL